MEKVVGVGEMIVSDDDDDVIRLYGLGTCIGLIVYCPIKKVLGAAHFLLPHSEINRDLGKISPAYFVDTGVDAIINMICVEYKCNKNTLRVGVYGGSKSGSKNDVFHIGKRNVAAVKEKLTSHNISITNSDTGGKYSRTITAKVKDGTINLKTLGNNLI